MRTSSSAAALLVLSNALSFSVCRQWSSGSSFIKATLLGAVILGLAMPPAMLGEELILPETHTAVQTRLTADGFVYLARDGQFALPQFRAYDRLGRQIFDTEDGFDISTFEIGFGLAVNTQTPIPGSEITLELEADRLETMDAEPYVLEPLTHESPWEVTIIKMEADWCAPCHAQTRKLNELLPRFKDKKIRIILVDEPRRPLDFVDADPVPPE